MVVLGGLAYANIGLKRDDRRSPVTVEKIEARDLESIVSASGKIQPKQLGQHQRRDDGQGRQRRTSTKATSSRRASCCSQIDPKNLETAVQNREASLASAKSQLDQTQGADRERQGRAEGGRGHAASAQEQMFKAGLLPREQLRARA